MVRTSIKNHPANTPYARLIPYLRSVVSEALLAIREGDLLRTWDDVLAAERQAQAATAKEHEAYVIASTRAAEQDQALRTIAAMVADDDVRADCGPTGHRALDRIAALAVAKEGKA